MAESGIGQPMGAIAGSACCRSGGLEVQRGDNIIGSSLEVKVRIRATPDQYGLLKQYEQDLPEHLHRFSGRAEKRPGHAHKPDFSV
jgi:hypothetical protein